MRNAILRNHLNLNCSNLESGLSFLYMNIRSISNKFDKLTNFLSQPRMKLPIVGISETWLDVDCYHFPNIVGYNFLHKARVNRVGGGVGLYIGEHLNYKERPDLAFPVDGSAESLFVEINRTKEKNVIVGVFYRPPDSNLNEFLSDLDHVLEKITKENKLVFLIGDWNLNLINHHCHKVTSDFLDLLYSRMFFPLITRPTGITANKALLIDSIFTKDPLCPSLNGLFLNDISDHLPIFALVLNNHSTGDRNKYVIFREKNAHSLNAFKEDLGKINWAELLGLDDPSCAYKIFIEKYVAFMIGVFHSKERKQNDLIFASPGLLKVLLNPLKRKIFCISVFLITRTLPMKMHTNLIKTNLPILFELLSVYVMKNKLRS